MYAVREDWSLPADEKFLVLLRNGNDKKGNAREACRLCRQRVP